MVKRLGKEVVEVVLEGEVYVLVVFLYWEWDLKVGRGGGGWMSG